MINCILRGALRDQRTAYGGLRHMDRKLCDKECCDKAYDKHDRPVVKERPYVNGCNTWGGTGSDSSFNGWISVDIDTCKDRVAVVLNTIVAIKFSSST